jgi:SAM-dependent methyltransferase
MSTKPKETPKEMPEPFMEGLIPTMNHRGFMSETTDSYSRKFANYAGSIDAESLDIGCAYGVATLAALDNGARVVACDMDAGHIEVLEGRVPPHRRSQLRTAHQRWRAARCQFPCPGFWGYSLFARTAFYAG